MTIKTSRLELPSPEDGEAANGPAQIKAITDRLELLHTQSVRVLRDATQAIANETFTAIKFEEEDWDLGAMHLNTAEVASKLVATVKGLYLVTACVSIAGNATGVRSFSITKGGAPAKTKSFAETSEGGRTAPGEGAAGNALALSVAVPLEVGQYVECYVWQNSGGSLNVMGGDGVHRSQMAANWVGAYPL